MKITFLGTSAGLPTKERNTQTTILDLSPLYNEWWLFDAGEAAQHQILNTPYKLGKLTTILITHLHGDHLFGLPGLLTSRSFQGGADKPLTIYGPVGIQSFVETVLTVSCSHLNYPIQIIELEPENHQLEIHDIQVTAMPLNHGILSFGYRLQLPDKEGGLLTDQLITAGIEPGPVYRQFKEQQQVEWNGVMYETAQFKGEAVKGKTLVFFGDTKPHANEYLLADNADVIVHECTYLDGDQQLSHQYFHTHLTDLVRLIEESNVKKVLINHVSNRYTKEDIIMLTEQIHETYPELDFVIAEDFMTVEI